MCIRRQRAATSTLDQANRTSSDSALSVNAPNVLHASTESVCSAFQVLILMHSNTPTKVFRLPFCFLEGLVIFNPKHCAGTCEVHTRHGEVMYWRTRLHALAGVRGGVQPSRILFVSRPRPHMTFSAMLYGFGGHGIDTALDYTTLLRTPVKHHSRDCTLSIFAQRCQLSSRN